MKSLNYARYLLRHKWFVFYAGLKLVDGISFWRLLIHDWSKFSPLEWRAYRNSFHGTRTPAVDAAFDRAWLHHIHKNPHHWNHWVMPGAVSLDVGSKPKVLPMPEKFAREMVADWYGAGRAQTGQWGAHKWYEINREKVMLHDDTRLYIESLLSLIEGNLR